ncbi:MAG: response regulator [Gammaproteobacteria bacterium]|jgi:CheY-like chemotaxis protein|nr:response regulator [Gammaproteobacteria bacterium]
MPQQTILVIDDDPAIQTVLEIALRAAGYRVELASDGREGVHLLETSHPSLVICDMLMPKMDGVETFNTIKSRLQDDGIPIFITSALQRKPWFAALEAEGAVVLQKPIELDRLLQLIDAALS